MTGNAANRVLRDIIDRIVIHEDRTAEVVPFPWVKEWMVPDT